MKKVILRIILVYQFLDYTDVQPKTKKNLVESSFSQPSKKIFVNIQKLVLSKPFL